MKWKKCNGRKQ